jgi:hypothetical protein
MLWSLRLLQLLLLPLLLHRMHDFTHHSFVHASTSALHQVLEHALSPAPSQADT